MIAEKIRSVGLALGVLAGKVDEEVWNLVKMARGELSDAADTVEELEAALLAPRIESETREPLQLRVLEGNKEACRAQA